MDRSDNGASSNLKRKAANPLASSGLKKPRLSLAARFPTLSSRTPSQSKGRNSATQFNENPRSGGTHISSRKGKEKASDSYRETSFEELSASGDISSSTNRPSFSKDIQFVSRQGSAKASSSTSNGTSGSTTTRARPSSWIQRKTTLQDPISISSDSDEGKEKTIPTKKGKRLWKSTGQMDVVDLTFDDDDDEITVIEVTKKRSPNRMKGRRSQSHKVKKAEKSRKSNASFDDERILSTEAPSPSVLPTPPKSENDEPESSEDTGTIEQRPRKLASINNSNKSQVSRHMLPSNLEVIDLCTDDSSDELPSELLGTDGLFPFLGDNTEDAHDTMDTIPCSSSGLIDQSHPSPSPGPGDFNDALPAEPLDIDGQPSSLTNSTGNALDTMGIVPLTLSHENHPLPSPGVGDSSHELPNGPSGGDGQLRDNTENTHDTVDDLPWTNFFNRSHNASEGDSSDEPPNQPPSLLELPAKVNMKNAGDNVDTVLSSSSNFVNINVGFSDSSGESLGIDGQPPEETNTENAHSTMDIVPLGLIDRNPSPDVIDFSDQMPNEFLDFVPLLSSGLTDTVFNDEIAGQSLGIGGQLASTGPDTDNVHDTLGIAPLELADRNQSPPSVADFSDQLPNEALGVDGQPSSPKANTENAQDIAGPVPSSSSELINPGVGDSSDGGMDGKPPSETNTENTRDMDIVALSSSEPSPSPGVGEPAISSDSDPTEALIDTISELEISPLLNSHEEEEVLRDILLEDDVVYREEEMLVENPIPDMDTSPDESSSNNEKDNSDTHSAEKHAPEPVDTPDHEFPSGNLVKEPDFSKISTEATEPVPDYDDRLNAAIKWPAEKLPTELHDMINALPTNYLYNPQMRHIFEAMIEDNTAADEPRAPKIRIIGRKNGPVTPPWEFYYTNRIVNGEGVPRSDKKLLQGCDCIGPCDPKSKTCACVQRQMAWTGGEIKGFLYRKERLLHPHYPVFECNDACECSERCMNRVIQHGRKYPLSITLTKNKGWGVFADEKIPRGSYLGIYAGEMILEAEADERGKLYDRYGRTYLFDLDFYHLRALDKDKDKDKDKDRDGDTSTYTIDAFHVGNFTRFLNHSCDPNCQITPTYVNEPDLHKPALTIFTSRDVQKGEELTFSYLGEADSEETDEEVDENMINVEAGPSSHKQQAVHRRCLCGAANCRGQMF